MGNQDPIHETPAAAWQHLVQFGGIELSGRDEGLDQLLLQKLRPGGTGLAVALASASMNAFLRAFFGVLQPYVEMMKDIVRLFESLGATTGKAAWRLRLDDLNADLDQFRQWIQAWSQEATLVTVPAIDFDGAWQMLKALRTNAAAEEAVMSTFQSPSSLPRSVQNWVGAYGGKSEYQPLPEALRPGHCDPALNKCATVLLACLMLLEGTSHDELVDEFRRGIDKVDRSDAYGLLMLGQNETDFWLRSSVCALAAVCEQAQEQIQVVGAELAGVLDAYPTRQLEVNVSVSNLEAILSLPIWQKRHELYAVWVAAVMVRALEGHEYSVHHQDGKLDFAFKETPLVSVTTSSVPLSLISEKRSPLTSPKGHGRIGSVQPDYGIWETGATEVCRLVVECKHYKRAANRRFGEVLEDYARAHPEAPVYLVNYGPIGDALQHVPPDLHARCHCIDGLIPTNMAQLEQLATAVRTTVGPPIKAWIQATQRGATVALAVDVSGSMTNTLESEWFVPWCTAFCETNNVAVLAAADTMVRERWSPSADAVEALTRYQGDMTNLVGPVLELLKDVDEVVVITDDEGALTLARVRHEQIKFIDCGPEVCALVCRKNSLVA